MPASGDPAQGGGVADGPAVSEPASNPPVVSELERDNGPHDADAGSCPALPPRRSFLRGALGAGVTGAVTGVVAGAAAGAGAGYAYRSSQAAAPGQVLDAEMLGGRLPAVPFHGQHQAGILAKPQRQTVMLSFNVTADGRGELTDLLRTITARARFLTAGGVPPQVGIGGPPADSGVLGPTVIPDGLTVTVGAGSTLFDDRYGLAARKPAGADPDDRLPQRRPRPGAVRRGPEPAAECGQPGHGAARAPGHRPAHPGRHAGAVAHRRVLQPGPAGRHHAPEPAGLHGRHRQPRHQPAEAMNNLVWVQPGAQGEPAWTAHGSYQVVRLIRMFVEFWDRVDIIEQENMIGRRKDTGAPLDANAEFARPDYTLDPTGDVIPLTAHIRLANPRTPQTERNRILRRAHNYDRGIDSVGDLDMGLIFVCYQQDIARQFATVQTRLISEPMADFISPFGGGYFFTLPGVRDSRDYLGRGLLA